MTTFHMSFNSASGRVPSTFDWAQIWKVSFSGRLVFGLTLSLFHCLALAYSLWQMLLLRNLISIGNHVQYTLEQETHTHVRCKNYRNKYNLNHFVYIHIWAWKHYTNWIWLTTTISASQIAWALHHQVFHRYTMNNKTIHLLCISNTLAHLLAIVLWV